MAKEFSLTPQEVKPVSTKYRTISGMIPNEQTIEQITKLREAEPQSMRGQPPIVWDHAEGINVFDAYGNKWLDFSSGVLIANAGHGRKKMIEAIVRQAQKPLLTTY